MTAGRRLLPPNAVPWEMALADTLALVFETPNPLDLLMDSARCPERFLPWLAATLSVDVWDDGWDAVKKRLVISNAVIDQREKGTLATLERYTGYRDAAILRVIRPPMRFFAGGLTTPAEMAAWLAALPQIRVYLKRSKASARPMLFAGGVRSMFWEGRFAFPSTAALRAGERATLWRDGEERPIGTGTWNGNELTISAPAKAGPRFFVNTLRGRQFACPSTAKDHVYRIAFDDSADLQAIFPGGRLQTTRPEIVSDRGVHTRTFFAGCLLHKRYAWPKEGAARVYRRVPIVDDTAPSRPRRSVSFASLTRLRVPDHTAELSITIPGKGCPLIFYAGGRIGMFALPSRAAERVRPVFDAVRAGKRFTDKILINTNLHRPLTAGTDLFAGQPYHAGQWTLA